jgi:glyoxylase-like metal-dependent hydrolase (beta-lactamase superfamily II)
MAAYTITPLDLGSCRREKSFFTYMTDVGTQIELAIISFLVTGGGRAILVDTGAPLPAQALPRHLPYSQTAAQTLPRQLAEHDLDPSEVDAVIYTHLHWDHAYNTEALTAARFFVSRRELEFARDPYPIQDWMYDAPSAGGTPDYLSVDFEFTDPDREVFDGIRVVPTPGHSPGHQSVVVSTSSGPVILAGDLAPLQENWDRQIPNGMLHNLEEHFVSFERLQRIGGRVIPSHDPRNLTLWDDPQLGGTSTATLHQNNTSAAT